MYVTCWPRLNYNPDDLVPPWTVNDENPTAARWGENGVGAAPFFAAIIGCGYLALHDDFFDERIAWLVEQERAGTLRQALGPNLGQTLILQQQCRRAIQAAEAWTHRLAGNQLGQLQHGPRVLDFEIDLRRHSFRLGGLEADIGRGQPLYLLAALAYEAGRRLTAGQLTELMRRLGYTRYRDTDSTFDLGVAKYRLLERLREASAGRLDVNRWIEGNDFGLSLMLPKSSFALFCHPLLPARRHV